MSLRHIEAFRAVSLSGSMTEAATQLHTSQPQISRLISQLEEITEFSLFNRNGSRLSPTVDGQRFYREVEETFAGLAALETAAARIRSFSASRLSVSAMPRLAGGMLARAVVEFKREFPDVMVAIHSSDAESVNAWVSSGLCDVGLAMLSAEVKGVRPQTICTVECVAILPPGHPLGDREVIVPSDLDGEPLIAFPSGSALRGRIDAAFAAAGSRPVITAEASLGASVCAFVSAGLGVSVINPLAAAEEQFLAGLIIKPFQPSLTIDVVLLFPEHQSQHRLVSAFSRCASRVIKSEIDALAKDLWSPPG